MTTERYQRGWEKLMEIDGEGGEKVIESLQDIAPDLGRYIVEFAFGDIYSRDGLDLKQKQLVTLASLTLLLMWGSHLKRSWKRSRIVFPTQAFHVC
jgi:4-carboxymuconolactone decarboxylase